MPVGNDYDFGQENNYQQLSDFFYDFFIVWEQNAELYNMGNVTKYKIVSKLNWIYRKFLSFNI